MSRTRTPLEVFQAYNTALEVGDFPTAMSHFAADVVWHQPGASKLSGTILGIEQLGAHLGRFMAESAGTFKIATEWAAANGDFIAAHVMFTAQKPDGTTLELAGTDLFFITEGKIKEVWLFTADQAVEDAFWGQ